MVKREWWKENVKSKEISKRNEARLGETSKEIQSLGESQSKKEEMDGINKKRAVRLNSCLRTVGFIYSDRIFTQGIPLWCFGT